MGSQSQSENPLDNPSSRELAVLKAADAVAWEQFYRRYHGLIAHWCGSAGVARQDIQDLVQEVFSRVFETLRGFQPNGHAGCFTSWLSRLTLSKVVSYYRALGHWPQPLVAEPADNDADVGSRAWADEGGRENSDPFANLLRQVGYEVGERAWKVFWRAVVDACPEVEIAADMNMSPGAVRICKHRVLKRLREVAESSGVGAGTLGRRK